MFRIATSPEEILKVYAVRSIVFIEEQRCPWELEFDGLDQHAIHILGEVDGEPAAAARIRLLDDYAKLERIAVRAGYRGRRIGDRLVDYMVSVAHQHGYTTIKMHAQAHLTEFYHAHGFEVCGDLFDEAGIDHYPMIRND
jgi:predicted GNAT family N-acyltransferase